MKFSGIEPQSRWRTRSRDCDEELAQQVLDEMLPFAAADSRILVRDLRPDADARALRDAFLARP